MVDYFITKACKNTTQSNKDMYDCYYAEDTLTNRLFYKEGEHIEENYRYREKQDSLLH